MQGCSFPLILSSVLVSFPLFRFLTAPAGSAVPSTQCRGRTGRHSSHSSLLRMKAMHASKSWLSHKDKNASQISATTARNEPKIQSDGRSKEPSGRSNSCRLRVLLRDGSALGCPAYGCGLLLPTPLPFIPTLLLLSARPSIQLFFLPQPGRLSALPAATEGDFSPC